MNGFYDAEGNWLYTGKLKGPTGTYTYSFAAVPTPDALYAGEAIENFEAWVDADGNVVTEVTGNMDVYAKVAHVHKYVTIGQGQIDKILSGFDGVAGKIDICAGIGTGVGCALSIHGTTTGDEHIFALQGEKIECIHSKPSLLCGVAAIDGQGDTGYIACRIAAKEHSGGCHLFRGDGAL